MLVPRAAAKEPEDTVYRLYYDFKVPVGRAQGHQVLAVNRGEREGFSRSRWSMDRETALAPGPPGRGARRGLHGLCPGGGGGRL